MPRFADVREALQRLVRVWAAFGPADQKQARSWCREGVPLQAVARHPAGQHAQVAVDAHLEVPGTHRESLRYFEKSLQEICDNPLPEDYREHLERNLALNRSTGRLIRRKRRAGRGGEAVCNGRSGTPVACSPEDRENGPGGDGQGGVA